MVYLGDPIYQEGSQQMQYMVAQSACGHAGNAREDITSPSAGKRGAIGSTPCGRSWGVPDHTLQYQRTEPCYLQATASVADPFKLDVRSLVG